jgi:hypothetical protein
MSDPGGPYDYETSRLPHFIDSRLTDGGKVVSLTRRPRFTPRKIRGSSSPKSFILLVFRGLVNRWDKYLNLQGDYVEK